MGRPEECAGLLGMGFDPVTISKILAVTTQSVVDYLYRAVGKGYISTADIVLSIPANFRAEIDTCVERLNTEYWFAISRALSEKGSRLDRGLLELYLHLRRPAGLNSPATQSAAGFVMWEIQTGLHKPEGGTKQRLTKSADNSAPVYFPKRAWTSLGSWVSFHLPLA